MRLKNQYSTRLYIITALLIALNSTACKAQEENSAAFKQSNSQPTNNKKSEVVDDDSVNVSNLKKQPFHKKTLTEPVDSIVVVKRFHHMYVFNKKKLLKVYRIALGTQPVGPKHVKGDLKTPEGIYYINGENPFSVAHKSLAISYPNDADRKYASSLGKSPGGDIKIHGTMNGDEDPAEDTISEDWTWGCIAITNKEIDELYAHIILGSPINILP
ncbi:MAG: L,D-transpeptidase family protein [Taibaiella sp.]|nr:L,D-transpeptidase family protein [Taibaiella sp.]